MSDFLFKINDVAKNHPGYKIPDSFNYKYKLDMGEWDNPIHPEVFKELNLQKQPYCRYVSHDIIYNKFIDELAKYTSSNNENIMITNGSDNALRLILELFATDDSTILVPTPTYPHFESMLKIHKSKVENLYIDYQTSDKDIFDSIISTIKSSYLDEKRSPIDMCYLVNPNMPIGYILENIELLLQLFPSTLFVVDEAYIEFVSEYQKYTTSSLSLTYKNIITVRTFSKFYSLASLRLGYLIAHKEVINRLVPYYNCKDITSVAIRCGLQTLLNVDWYKKRITQIEKVKEYLHAELRDITDKQKKIKGYFIRTGMYFNIISDDPQGLYCYLRDSHGIITRNKNADMKGVVRISLADMHIMKEVVQALKEYCFIF